MGEKLIIECDYATANLLQATLEDENISCRLVDQENVASFMTNGGKLPMVQVFVYESDYAKAIALLKPLMDEKDTRLSWCPKCGSEDITRKVETNKRGSIWLLVGSIIMIPICIWSIMVDNFVGFVFLFAPTFMLYAYFKPDKEKYICNNCGHTFRQM